ncbi:MAG: arylamine N-acetyltransferase family protein [Calditrichia bacterium]
MDVRHYLKRIDSSLRQEASLDYLTQLHRNHLMSVPFENLDIVLGSPIELSNAAIFQKIVENNRGGFCYELNGLFAWLLTELKFDVTMLSGRVIKDGKPGPEFDHMLLLVKLEKPYLADVGFGESFTEPIPLDDQEHCQRGVCYRVLEREDGLMLAEKKPGKLWEDQLLFTLEPRGLSDFEDTCLYQQTDPNSTFTNHTKCSMATENGRVTFWDNRLIITSDKERTKQPIVSEEQVRGILRDHFAIILPEFVKKQKLLRPISS